MFRAGAAHAEIDHGAGNDGLDATPSQLALRGQFAALDLRKPGLAAFEDMILAWF